MSYRKDQGRYARMLAFWALLFLIAYGCFHVGGFVSVLDRWMGDSNSVLVAHFPLLGQFKISTVIALALVAGSGLLIHRILNRPKIVDALVETEAEMRKVTWPTWPEAWQGTMAVTCMVLVLFVFLTGVDLLLSRVMLMLMPGGGS